mmetsp:Transcript_28692/g.69598  ORF Transcript_28692/g.69598 Transcript_28692/m.69598 type:complete len:107 (-) Transcript_28692:45-365(-)
MTRLCRHQKWLPSMAFVCQNLCNDKDFIMEVTLGMIPLKDPSNGSEKNEILAYASPRPRDDKDAVISAARVSGLNLKHAPSTLRRDLDVVRPVSRTVPHPESGTDQ